MQCMKNISTSTACTHTENQKQVYRHTITSTKNWLVSTPLKTIRRWSNLTNQPTNQPTTLPLSQRPSPRPPPGDQWCVWCPWLCAHRQCLKLLNTLDLLRRHPLAMVAFSTRLWLSARSFLLTLSFIVTIKSQIPRWHAQGQIRLPGHMKPKLFLERIVFWKTGLNLNQKISERGLELSCDFT